MSNYILQEIRCIYLTILNFVYSLLTKNPWEHDVWCYQVLVEACATPINAYHLNFDVQPDIYPVIVPDMGSANEIIQRILSLAEPMSIWNKTNQRSEKWLHCKNRYWPQDFGWLIAADKRYKESKHYDLNCKSHRDFTEHGYKRCL